MYAEISSAIQSLKALNDIVSATKTLTDYNGLVAAVSDVNSKLMAATAVALSSQEKQSVMASRIAELEQEISSLKNWNAEKENYSLTEVAHGVFAYIPKVNQAPLMSAHKYCVNCFNKGLKVLLQQQNVEVGRQLSLNCVNCKPPLVFRYYIEEKT